MYNTKLTFLARCDEVRHYMHFLQSVDAASTAVVDLTTQSKLKKIKRKWYVFLPRKKDLRPISNETKKILRANIYLLLYNLIESTVRNTFEEVYTHLKANSITFQEIRDELRHEVLRNLKKYMIDWSVEDFSCQIADLNTDVIHLTYCPEKRFNGNVDARFMRTQVENMGFQIIADSVSRNGADLVSIKSLRNSLAHGDISFCDCGKDLTSSELLAMCERTFAYLSSFIDCTEEYLNKNTYKKTA